MVISIHCLLSHNDRFIFANYWKIITIPVHADCVWLVVYAACTSLGRSIFISPLSAIQIDQVTIHRKSIRENYVPLFLAELGIIFDNKKKMKR